MSSPRWKKKVETNDEALQQTAEVQQDTLASLHRAQQDAWQAQDVGVTTLEELQAQRAQLDLIQQEGDRLNDGLQTAEKLQNRLGKWSFAWRSNKVAKKQVDEERKQQEELDRKAELRRTQREQELEEQRKANSTENQTVITPRRRPKNGRKKASSPAKNSKTNGLLEGIGEQHEHRAEFERLADTDAEIDRNLDQLGSQLDALMALGKEIGQETRNQSGAISNVTTQVEETNYRQKVINKRTTRFFTGRKRQEVEKQDSFNPAALARMAAQSEEC